MQGLSSFAASRRGGLLDFDKDDFICIVGLAPLCAMLRPPFFGSLITSLIENPSVMRLAYDGSLILWGLILMLLVSKSGVLLARKGSLGILCSGALTAVGAIGINVGRSLGFAFLGFFVFCILVVSLGFAALILAWFQRLSAVPRDRISSLVLAAFVVSHVFGLLDAMPRGAAAFVSSSYPLLSAAVLFWGLKGGFSEGASGCACEGEASACDDLRFSNMRSLALLLIVVEVLCGALLRSRWAHGGVDYAPDSNTAFKYLVSALMGVALLFVARGARFGADGALGVGAVGLLGFSLATVLFSIMPLWLLASFVTGLYSALLVFMMALLLLRGHDGDRPVVFSAGFFLVLYGFVSGLSTSVIPFALSYQGFMPDEYLAVIGIVAGLVVSLGVGAALFFMVVVQRDSYLEVLDRAHLLQGDGVLSDSGESPSALAAHEGAVDRVALKYGLTAREKETAALVSQGYSVKRVAEELGLAPATIQGYSKSLYRKLGIHKKDELIEMIDLARRNL